jgi:hypothetical protein
MLKLELFDETNYKDFLHRFSAIINELDIYYQPQFLIAEALMQKGKFEIFTCQLNDAVFIYPYILLPFKDGNHVDMISPYGYCGPFCNDESFFEQAESKFIEFAKNKNVVSEFIRYHWLYNNEEKFRFKNAVQNIENRNIVVLDTKRDFETIWKESYSSTNRNVIRKVEKEGFLWDIKKFENSDICTFLTIYNATMKNSGATDFYYFNESYFENLIKNLGPKLRFCTVTKEHVIYGVSLFFISENIVTYYLSGRNVNYPKISATNFLLSKMIEWCTTHKIAYFNLGGGLSNDIEDSLFKFKRNFSKELYSFYIGKRIHNVEYYEYLKKDYIKKNGVTKYENVRHLLQFYHE